MTWVETMHGSSSVFGQAMGVLLSSYLLGCFSTGYYFIRLRTGKDIHDLGSGNIGAKNAGRIAGPVGFVVTLLGDAAKGALAVWLVRQYTGNEWLVMLAAVGVLLGHLWPVQLRFHGGKGMSTSLGAMLVYDYRSILAYAVIVALTFAWLRNSVLSGLLTFALVPLVCLLWGAETVTTTGIASLAALVWFAHRKNLAEELAGFSARRHTQPDPSPPTKQS